MCVTTDGAEAMEERDRRPRRPRRTRAIAAGVVAGAVAIAGLTLASSPFAAPAPAGQAPAFVQQVSKRVNATTLTLQPTANVTAGNRLIVEVGVWGSAGRTIASVTDSAG